MQATIQAKELAILRIERNVAENKKLRVKEIMKLNKKVLEEEEKNLYKAQEITVNDDEENTEK